MTNERSTEWYKVAFGALYPALYAHRDDTSASAEIAGLIDYLQLAGTGATTLDLCCGNGRHACELIEAGLKVVGFDLSPELLAIAAERFQTEGRLIRGDMRALPFADRFDLVVNLFTSFGYFPDDEANQLALSEMVRVLRSGGRLVIDHINRALVKRTLVPESEMQGEGFHVRQRRSVAGNRVRKQITITWADGRIDNLLEDVRLYHPDEIIALAAQAGLTDIRLIGSYQGTPFETSSPRMIVTATKQPAME